MTIIRGCFAARTFVTSHAVAIEISVLPIDWSYSVCTFAMSHAGFLSIRGRLVAVVLVVFTVIAGNTIRTNAKISPLKVVIVNNTSSAILTGIRFIAKRVADKFFAVKTSVRFRTSAVSVGNEASIWVFLDETLATVVANMVLAEIHSRLAMVSFESLLACAAMSMTLILTFARVLAHLRFGNLERYCSGFACIERHVTMHTTVRTLTV